MTLHRRGFLQASTLGLSIGATGLGTGILPATAKAPLSGAVAPSFYRFKLGDFEITALHDGAGSRPLDASFVRNAEMKDVQAVLAESNLPTDKLTISFTTLLVNTGSKLVLLDTGFADNGGPTNGKTIAQMKAAGIDPKDVDAVILSHFHGDHLQGARFKDGKLAYPNAEIMAPEAEWNFWMDDARMAAAPDGMKGAFQGVRRVLAPNAGDVKRFAWGKEVAPGITAVDASGHTPGHTAFVIAADDKMIRQAVKVHFKDIALDDDLVTNYFDKLIQIPIRVPPLGTQDVRAYLMLLFIENSGLPVEQRDEIRTAVCQRLSETWQGKRIDISFVKGLIKDCSPELAAQLALADRLAPLMTTSDKIAGNPRLIKRFLNTLHIRLATAKAQKVAADEATLAKLLLFERCGKEEAYRQLVREVNDNEEGKPLFLAPWETAALKGAEFKPDAPWEEPFARAWLALEPSFADTDLRAAVYVSRDHMPIVMAADQLSKEAVDLLEAVLKVTTQVSTPVAEKLKGLSPREQALVSDRVLHRARQTQDWGTPPILYACLTLASVTRVPVRRLFAHDPAQPHFSGVDPDSLG